MAFYLALIDVGSNVLFAYPSDPRDVSPSKLRQYFEYGRSVEGKLARMTRRTDEESAPIVAFGWRESASELLSADGIHGLRRPVVTFYGMSHARLLAKDLAELDRSLEVRSRAAPLAVPTWSLAAYSADRERVRSDVVVLAVMTNTIPLLATTSGATMYFDGAYPYTYPRYVLEDGVLRSEPPPFSSLEGYRRFFFDRTLWEEYVGWLAKHDKYYDPLLFRGTALDRSSLVRLLRRAYALASRRAKQAEVYDDVRGFDTGSEEARMLEAVVAEFALLARKDGAIPVVYIVNNLNTGDRALRLVEPTLVKHRIAYLSSHQIVPPNEPRFYLPDSHFAPAKNLELAQAMGRLIRGQLERH